MPLKPRLWCFVVRVVGGDQYDADLGLPGIDKVVPDFSAGGGQVAHDDGPDGPNVPNGPDDAVSCCEQKEMICRERHIRWELKAKITLRRKREEEEEEGKETQKRKNESGDVNSTSPHLGNEPEAVLVQEQSQHRQALSSRSGC